MRCSLEKLITLRRIVQFQKCKLIPSAEREILSGKLRFPSPLRFKHASALSNILVAKSSLKTYIEKNFGIPGNEVYVDEDNQILEVVLDEEETATSSVRETSMVQDQIMVELMLLA